MKVILRKDYVHLGREGEIKEVKDGYARNFLIPNKIAIPLTEGSLRALKSSEEKRKKKLEQKRKALEELAAKISQITLSFSRPKNEEGSMFGSVSKSDVMKALKAANVDIERDKVIMNTPLKEFGSFEIEVNLSMDIKAKFKVNIVPS